MEIAGFAASVFIGIALGLIGGGGSILTMPVLVYLFHIEPILATAYSLFVVGTTGMIGSVSYFKKGLINVKTAIIFGIPSVIAVFLTRAYIIPAIPDHIIQIDQFIMTKSIMLMLLFAVLMIISSYNMIRKEKKEAAYTNAAQSFNYPLILLEGCVIGILTGLVGAGGGFLIIPALVLLSKLPMREAVGTSLVIIAAKSLIGFLGENELSSMDWVFLLKVTSFAIGGVFIGMTLSKKISSEKLKPAFGWFVLVMGIYIILKETLI